MLWRNLIPSLVILPSSGETTEEEGNLWFYQHCMGNNYRPGVLPMSPGYHRIAVNTEYDEYRETEPTAVWNDQPPRLDRPVEPFPGYIWNTYKGGRFDGNNNIACYRFYCGQYKESMFDVDWDYRHCFNTFEMVKTCQFIQDYLIEEDFRLPFLDQFLYYWVHHFHMEPLEDRCWVEFENRGMYRLMTKDYAPPLEIVKDRRAGWAEWITHLYLWDNREVSMIDQHEFVDRITNKTAILGNFLGGDLFPASHT